MTTFSEACSFGFELKCLWCGVIMEAHLTLKSSTARRALSICRTKPALSKVASNTYRQNKAHIWPKKKPVFDIHPSFFSVGKDKICQMVLITAFLEW